jgi:hypothetical protein
LACGSGCAAKPLLSPYFHLLVIVQSPLRILPFMVVNTVVTISGFFVVVVDVLLSPTAAIDHVVPAVRLIFVVVPLPSHSSFCMISGYRYLLVPVASQVL